MAFFRRLGKLEVQVTADTSGFTAGMRLVNQSVNAVKGTLSGFARVAGRMGSTLARITSKVTALSAAIAGGGFVVLTVRAFKATGTLSRLSRQLGVTVADLARARHASILAGEGTKLFDSRIQRLSSQLRNAGAKTAVFKSAIQGWVAEVAKGGAEASKFGLVVDDAFARMVERANVAAQRLRQAFVGRFRQIAVALAPFVEFAANKLTEFVTAGTTDFKLVDKGMGFVRDTIAEILGLLAGGQRVWLEWKVAGLEAAQAISKAWRGVGDAVRDFMGLGPDATGAGKAWSTFEPRTARLRALKARGAAEEMRKSTGKITEVLKEARKQLAEFGAKPKWKGQFISWFDDLIKKAKENMDEFGRTMEPPKLKDFKLPRIETQLAPSIAAGSVAAQQASFRAQGQQGGMGESLKKLVQQGSRSAGVDDTKVNALRAILYAMEHQPVIRMGT